MVRHLLRDFLNPAYAVFGMIVMAALARIVSRAVPFYRRALGTEAATRLTPLDGLRGLLCFAVLFSHAAITRADLRTGLWSAPTGRFYNLLGQTSVGLFFCVTGFLFWTRVLATGGDVAVGPFLRARTFRVVPLYVVASLTVLVVAAPHVRWAARSTVVGLGRMAAVGFLPWGTPGDGTPFGPVDAFVTWTLQYEWAFYLLLPALAAAVQAGRPAAITAAVAGLLTLVGYGPHVYFGAGMLAAHCGRSPVVARQLRHPFVSAAVLACFTLLPAVTADGYGPTAVLLTTLAFIPIACGNHLFGLLNHRGLRVMGIASYSVYLLHGTALYAARPWLGRWRADGAADVIRYWSAIYAVGIGVLVVSLATFRWIEHPFIGYEKRTRPTPATDSIVHDLGPPA